ncbi:MAG TPA: ABC transporter permease [Coprothermobacter sp.]|nr:ABC transporter permease [Coprothermobacter sp.]
MIGLVQRNMTVFFRDKAAVFFSLISALIVFGLYVFFLGDLWTSNLNTIANGREIMDSWLTAGLLTVTSFTTAMGAYGVMVEDRVRGISKDFYASPVGRKDIVGGYVLSAFITGLIISVITLLLGEVYIVSNGGKWLDVFSFAKVIGVLIITSLMNNSLLFVLVSFFSTPVSFSAASTVVGTLIGFLTGVYVPTGVLSSSMQWVIKLFPVSHAGALLRQIVMDKPMSRGFSGVPAKQVVQVKETLGVVFTFENRLLQPWMHVLIILGTAVVFFLLGVFIVSRNRDFSK